MDVICLLCEDVYLKFIVYNYLLFILCLFYFCKYFLVYLLGLCVFIEFCCFLFVVIVN